MGQNIELKEKGWSPWLFRDRVRGEDVGNNRGTFINRELKRSKHLPKVEAEFKPRFKTLTLPVAPLCLSLWPISGLHKLPWPQRETLDQLEMELLETIKEFRYGVIQEDLTLSMRLDLNEVMSVNLRAYEGDYSMMYLSFYSEGKLIHKDYLDPENAISAIKIVSEATEGL